MAIITMSQLVAALAAQQRLDLNKASATSKGAGLWHSLWKLAGNPVAGSNQGSLAGAIPTNATAGGWPFANPAAGKASYLAQAIAAGTVSGTLILYDRLWHNSTMSGTVTGTNSLGATSAINRYLGEATELWGEVYSAIGATGATLTVSYTNQANTSGQSATYTHPASAEVVGQMFPMTLAAGDIGVRQVASYGWSVSTGTAGDFGVTILKRLAEIPIANANVGQPWDYADLGMPVVKDNACLALMVQCTSTTTGQFLGHLALVQG